MVASVVDHISLRDSPSQAGALIGYLPLGSRSFVVDGPISAHGYEWMLLAGPGIPPSSGCATFPTSELTCPVWFGWAAIADPASEDQWFVEDPTDCPDPASGDSRAIMMLGDIEALHCYADDQLELPGWLPSESLNDVPSCPNGDVAWLMCPQPSGLLFANQDEVVAIELFVDPASGLDLGITTGHVTVIGHLDDPAAEACNTAFVGHPDNPVLRQLNCRAKFVVDRVAVVAP